MSLAQSLNARSESMHKNPTPQTFVHESGKVGGRDRKDRGHEANGKKGRPTKQKLI